MKKDLYIGGCSQPMVMAISLDRREMTERIIIGQTSVVERWLAGVGKLSALYDIVRPMGTFLVEHEKQNKEVWAQHAGALLTEAVSSLAHRRDKAAAARSYLETRRGNHDMVCEFTVCQSLNWYRAYCTALGSREKGQEFSDRFLYLTRSFNLDLWGKSGDCSVEKAWHVVQKALNGRVRNTMEQTLVVRHAAWNRDEQWLLITESYYPVLQYYLKKLMIILKHMLLNH